MVENNIGFSEMVFKDIRPAPEGFTLAHSVKETITLIEKAEKDGAGIDLIDCDHDLGDYFSDGGDGIKLQKVFYIVTTQIGQATPFGFYSLEDTSKACNRSRFVI